LQFGDVRPVGGNREQHVDVRVVAATHRDLLAGVEEKTFREDLYYRLSTLVIDVPPLRSRPGDVVQLARLFLERECAKLDRKADFGPGALEALERLAWPGNVRELENALTRLATLTSGPTVTAADVERLVSARRRPAAASGALPTLDVEELERLAVHAALEKHGGNKRAAAAELGVSPKTLYSKLEKYAGG
jgi:DNA-binding NtrC family response regulator